MTLLVVRSQSTLGQGQAQGGAGRPARSRIVGGSARDLPRDHRDKAIDFRASPQTLGPGPAVLRLIAGSQKAGYRLDWQRPKADEEPGEMDPATAAHLDAFSEHLDLSHHLHHVAGPLAPLLGFLFEHGREIGEFLETLGPSEAELQARANELQQAQTQDAGWKRGQRGSPIQRAVMRPQDRVGLGL
jgi:hypothetical protein